MIFMPVYQKMRRYRATKEGYFWDDALNSSVAATVAAIVTQPSDVIKTRMMTSRHERLTI